MYNNHAIKITALFAVLLLPFTIIKAQTTVENTARRALIVGRSLPQERVYLQFDNNGYYLGETMWFKAHVTAGNNDKASTLSKVLYVEIVAPEGYVVETKKYKLDENGCCHGEFELKPLMLSGYYEIRAYTRYMLNWGSEAIFSRVFPVYDKVNANNWDFKNMLDRKRGFMYRGEWINSELPDCDLKFYPEGGHIVAGITGKVAYELRGTDGAFSEDSITIYEDNKAVMVCAPTHNGKGFFNFTPKEESKYHAEVTTTKDGKKEVFKFDLPKIEKKGITLSIAQDKENVNITVRNNYSQDGEIGLAILHRGVMGYYKQIPTAEKEKTFTINKTSLLEGVSRAVVFTNSIPLAERQFFVQHSTLQENDRETVKLEVKANNYQLHNLKPNAHEKITLVIEREDGKPIDENAEFTISVTDAIGKQSTSWDYNMYTYLLLGSELKGYIPNASTYFDEKNIHREEQLDLLMLTHGWTSYDWNKLISGDISKMQPIEKGITLKGTLYEKRKNTEFGKKGSFILKPEKYNLTTIQFSYDNKEVEQSVFRTDSTGSFNIELADFYGKRIGVLIPKRRYMHTENVWYGYSLDRYYSPHFRLYDYWERNEGKPATTGSAEEEAKSIRINPFEYLLTPVEVTAEKEKTRYSRPPHSEMRFDYLDEWEYAQDITFLSNSSHEDRASELALNEYMTNNIMDVDMTNYRSQNTEDIDKFEEENNNENEKQHKDILDYMTPAGIITLNDSGNMYNKYIGRVRYGNSNAPFIGSNEKIHERTLTAEDVVKSAMYRHNYNWAYWVQLMAVLGEYNSDSVPRPDTDYYKGKDAAKMVNFKEIVIRSDIKTREQFENLGTHWERKSNALDSKSPDTKFYLGFLSQTYLIANEGVDGAPMPEIFYEQLSFGQGSGRSHPENPNYVACLIPYKENEMDSIKIIPDFLGNGTTRYTSIQGFNESKEFYSPNYGNMRPVASDKDYRRTLLWNPEIKAENGKLTLELYNSSYCEAIEVSVNGVADNTYYSNDKAVQTRILEIEETVSDIVLPLQEEGTERKYTFNADSASTAALAYEYELGDIYMKQNKYRQAVQIFSELIQYNYPPALRSIGICYTYGRGLKKDHARAIEFFFAAAKAGDAASMYDIAVLYKNGIGVEKNFDKALEWMEQAAEKNEPRAQAELGKYYQEVVKDIEKAGELYRASAMQKEPEGLYCYALYMIATSTEKDEALGTPMACIESAANMQNINAMLYMMWHYDKEQKYEQAYKWAYKLYLLNNREGTLYAADCFKNGKGVKKDKRTAEDLYREANQKAQAQ